MSNIKKIFEKLGYKMFFLDVRLLLALVVVLVIVISSMISLEFLPEGKKETYIKSKYYFEKDGYKIEFVRKFNNSVSLVPVNNKIKISRMRVYLLDKDKLPVDHMLFKYQNLENNKEENYEIKIGYGLYKFIKSNSIKKISFNNKKCMVFDFIYFDNVLKANRRIISYVVFDDSDSQYFLVDAFVRNDAKEYTLNKIDDFVRSLKLVKN